MAWQFSEITRERILSVTRHLMMGNGLSAFSASTAASLPGDAGRVLAEMALGAAAPRFLGLTLVEWNGLIVFVAGMVNAWFSKSPDLYAGPAPKNGVEKEPSRR